MKEDDLTKLITFRQYKKRCTLNESGEAAQCQDPDNETGDGTCSAAHCFGWDELSRVPVELDRLKAENAELRKRLKCPEVQWYMEQFASVFGLALGEISGDGWWSCADKDGTCEDSATPEADAKLALENYWKQIWNRMHGIAEPKS